MALQYLPGRLDVAAAQAGSVPTCARSSPRRRCSPRPCRARARPMSVRMTNCGPLGWVTDKEAAAIAIRRPIPRPGRPGRRCPQVLLDLWASVTAIQRRRRPASSTIMPATPRWGCTRTRMRRIFAAPVLSVSLGDTAIFRVGGLTRQRPDAQIRAKVRRRGGAGRRGPARLSRHRPHPSRHLGSAAPKADAST